MNWDYPPGATPLDPDEAEGLIPKHIVNHGQLNEWEFQNVLEGERWAFGRKRKAALVVSAAVTDGYDIRVRARSSPAVA